MELQPSIEGIKISPSCGLYALGCQFLPPDTDGHNLSLTGRARVP